jgi:hypothetical protein
MLKNITKNDIKNNVVKKNTTTNGGSLGSFIDEDRS